MRSIINLRLAAPALDFWVDVRLLRVGQRWIAVADITDEKELGLGHSPREALATALSAFGSSVVASLLLDQKA